MKPIFYISENKLYYRCSECGACYNLSDNVVQELPEMAKSVENIPDSAYERAIIFAGRCD